MELVQVASSTNTQGTKIMTHHKNFIILHQLAVARDALKKLRSPTENEKGALKKIREAIIALDR